jgi:hypothetical protein
MSRPRSQPSWRFVVLLVFLFAASATTPRIWQQVARSRHKETTDRGVATALSEVAVATAKQSVGATKEPDRDASTEPSPAPAQLPAVMYPAATATAPSDEPTHEVAQQGPSPATMPVEPSTVSLPDPVQPTASAAPKEEPPQPGRITLVLLPAAPSGAADTQPETPPASPPAEPASVNPEATTTSPEPAGPAPVSVAIEEKPSQMPDVPVDEPSAEEETQEQPVEETGIWLEPRSLLDRLDGLAWDCETGQWARNASRLVRHLGPAITSASGDVKTILDNLDATSAEADALAAALDRQRNPLGTKLRRARHALVRRLDIWRRVVALGGPSLKTESVPLDPREISKHVTKVAESLGDAEAGRRWRQHLDLDRLKQLAANPTDDEAESRRDTALRVLQRINRARATGPQWSFLNGGAYLELESQLRRWVLGPADLAAMLRHIELFERSGLLSDGQALADDCLRLGDSPLASYQKLAQRMEVHYRNANVRMVVTESLLNRLMPARQPQYQYVNEEMMGLPVRGQSVTTSNVQAKMIPDPNRLRTALVISGLVSALTTTEAGPATFYNNSQSTYSAWKEAELTMKGIQMQPAAVDVDNEIELRGVDTPLDGVPLLNRIARGIATGQAEQSRPAMSEEVKNRVAARAKQQIDEETDARLSKVSRRLDEKLLHPLASLSLGPSLISAETTPVRMTMRLRVATGEQLAASTPRPQAPADSLISMQLHESTLNNMLGQLDLDGQTMSVAELRKRIADRFNRPEVLKSQGDNEDAIIHFADQDAARVECRDGQAAIILTIASLRKPPHVWKDFQVRAFYRPSINGRQAELVRDGVIHLIGDRLDTGDQLALRGVFSKTFSNKQGLNVTPEVFLKDPRLARFGATQFVIDDGWIGLAFGPIRPLASPTVASKGSVPAAPQTR